MVPVLSSKSSKAVGAACAPSIEDLSAHWYLPGTVFPKWHEPVSRAAAEWAADGFTNVLNIGHNRVYQRND